MEHSDSIGQLAAAKAKAQAEFSPVKKDVHVDAGRYGYDYADLASCLAAVVPALSKHGLALFQPVRTADAFVVCTTLLVHESGEWIKEDLSMPVVDPTDAQSIGSACTYVKRYGAQGLLGFAPEGEDDDGQAARGGNQPMAKTKQVCPACGQTNAVIKGRPEYGGGFLCYKAKGGCGAKWQEDEIPMPKERPLKDEASLDMERRLEEANKRLPAEGKPAATQARASDPPASQPRAGSSKVTRRRVGNAEAEVTSPEPEQGRQDEGRSGQVATAAPVIPLQDGDARPPAALTFMYEGTEYTTFGMTEQQFIQSMLLVRQMDEKVARGAGRILLAEVLGVPVKKASRTDCTESEAQTWIEKMQKALEGR